MVKQAAMIEETQQSTCNLLIIRGCSIGSDSAHTSFEDQRGEQGGQGAGVLGRFITWRKAWLSLGIPSWTPIHVQACILGPCATPVSVSDVQLVLSSHFQSKSRISVSTLNHTMSSHNFGNQDSV